MKKVIRIVFVVAFFACLAVQGTSLYKTTKIMCSSEQGSTEMEEAYFQNYQVELVTTCGFVFIFAAFTVFAKGLRD